MKKFLSLILCFVMFFSLAACGESKEAKAFEKLKNIIIEKGTKTENEYSPEYTYTYTYKGDEFEYIYMLNIPDIIYYSTSFENGSVSLRFYKDDEKTFSGSSLVHNESIDSSLYGISSFNFEDINKFEYGSRTELEVSKYDLMDAPSYRYRSLKKEADKLFYSAVKRFSSAVDNFDMSITDFGFTSLDE